MVNLVTHLVGLEFMIGVPLNQLALVKTGMEENVKQNVLSAKALVTTELSVLSPNVKNSSAWNIRVWAY